MTRSRAKPAGLVRRLVFSLVLVIAVTVARGDKCDFENGRCNGWTSDCSSGNCFRPVKAQTPDSGPAQDHTSHTRDGWYGRAEVSSGSWFGKKEAAIRYQVATPGSFCFTGWYHVSGSRLPDLEFVESTSRGWFGLFTEEVVFQRAKLSQFYQWQKVVYQGNSKDKPKLLIRARNLDGAVVGIDDLSVTTGTCPPAPQDGSCTFDNGDVCGYTSSGWRRSPKFDREVFEDHSTVSDFGGYWYYKINPGAISSKVVLSSPKLPAPAQPRRCLRFHYYVPMSGVGGGLEVAVVTMSAPTGLNSHLFSHAKTVRTPVKVWGAYNTSLIPGRWVPAEATFMVTDNYEVHFDCYLNKPQYKMFFCAVDDVKVYDCAGNKDRNLTCDFGKGDMCNWESPKNVSGWKLTDNSRGELPLSIVDHTPGINKGMFLYVKGTSTSALTKAVLLSPPLDSNWKGMACFSFWHCGLSSGSASGNLTVATVPGGPLWSSRREVDMRWRKQVVRLYLPGNNNKTSNRVSLEASVLAGFFALDDLQLTLGRCPSDRLGLTCDFENGPCTWVTSLRSKHLWDLQGAVRRRKASRPETDHTLGNAEGSYMFLTVFKQDSAESELLSEVVDLEEPGTQCMDFWYIVNSGLLEVQMVPLTTGLVWNAKPGKSKKVTWLHGQLKVPRRHKIMFLGSILSGANDGYIALDDIVVYLNDSCQTLPEESSAGEQAYVLLDCLHEGESGCRWKGNKTASGDTWQRESVVPSNYTLAPKTPPTQKHGDAIYMKCEWLSTKDRDALTFTSPTITTQSDSICLSFYYHMFGGGSRDLRLELLSQEKGRGSTSRTVIFQATGGTTADRWYRVARTLKFNSQLSELQFRTSHERCVSGDIALSEIHASPGQCDPNFDGKGVCNFEDSSCGWTLEKPWKRVQIGQNSKMRETLTRSGPPDSESYLALTRKAGDPQTGVIESATWSGHHRPRCLQFWYLKGNPASDILKAAIRENSRLTVSLNVTQTKREPEYTWIMGRVQIPALKGDFQVALRGILRGGPVTGLLAGSLVAIDDVRFTEEPCSGIARCDFEWDLCGYINEFDAKLDPHFKWVVGPLRVWKPEFRTPIPAVPSDGPSGASDGWYKKWVAYVDASSPLVRTEATTTLRSSIFSVGSNETVLMRYFRKGAGITSLAVRQQILDEKYDKQRLVEIGQLGEVEDENWKDFEGNLQPAKATQLEIKVTRSKVQNGTVALASISIGQVIEDLVIKPESSTIVPIPGASTPTPQPVLSCDFEKGDFCSWIPEKNKPDQLDWTFNNPNKSEPRFPNFDHTTGGYHGRFAFVKNTALPGEKLAVARLQSPVLPEDWLRDGCFSFWYFTLANDNSSLSARLGARPIAWKDEGTQHITWTHGQMSFSESATKDKEQIVLEAWLDSGLIALDDLLVTSGPCPYSPKCTFEENGNNVGCGEASAMGNIRDWAVVEGSTLGVPDHTSLKTSGHFLYLNATNVEQSLHPYARLTLPLRAATSAACMSFWWRSHGTSSRLNVYRFSPAAGLRDPVLSLMTEETPQWWNGRSVTITSRTNWQPTFEVLLPQLTHTNSGVLLDDIEVTEGECPPEGYCSFEHASCMPWLDAHQENTKLTPVSSKWKLQRAGLATVTRDHTFGTADGHYLMFTGQKEGLSAGIVLVDRRYKCASLWYQLSEDLQGCAIFSRYLSLNVSTKGVWKHVLFNILGNDDGIFAIAGKNPKAYALIDDIRLSEQHCQDQAIETAEFRCGRDGKVLPVSKRCNFVKDCSDGSDENNCGNCTFEVDSCDWKLRGGAAIASPAFGWKRTKAGPQSGGPLKDHTKDSRDGFLLLLRADASINDMSVVSQALSPQFRDTAPSCVMKFWYNYMTANHTHGLQVILRVNDFHTIAWDLSALNEVQPEGVWLDGQVLIGRYPATVKVYLHGYEETTPLGYSAVDDIVLEDCGMPAPSEKQPGLFQCRNKVNVDMSYRCDYTDNCGDFSDEEDCEDHRYRCNFDTSFCDWTPEQPDGSFAHGWERHLPFRSLSQGPTRDHTTGNRQGHFIYLGSRAKMITAKILGPSLSNSSDCVMRFHYTAKGPSTTVLLVKTRTTVNGTFKEVWRSDSPTEFFHFTEASLRFNETKPFQVSIEGAVDGTRDTVGYVAIDDISFSEDCVPPPGPLPFAKPDSSVQPVTCSANQFTCATGGQCIPKNQVCDFRPQCTDKSDESHCGTCDFSVDMCGLKNEHSQAAMSWQRVSAQMVRNNRAKFPTLPIEDSTHHDKGFYLSLLQSTSSRGFPVQLVTPRMGPIGHYCTLSFYAKQQRDRKYALTLKAKPSNHDWYAILLSAVPSTESWERMSVNVGNMLAGAQFFFAGTQNVSIDDVEFKNCHPDDISVKSLNCTFEERDGCGWFPENINVNSEWVLVDSTPNFAVPDHTLGNGYYLQMRNLIQNNAKAQMVSSKLNATGARGRCFTFWYHMEDPRVGRLSILASDEKKPPTILWTRKGFQGKGWKQAQINVIRSDVFKLIIEGVLPSTSSAFIGIDDIVLEEGPCKPTLACDFEQGPCGWMMEGWSIVSAMSTKIPPADHTTGTNNGKFAKVRLISGRMLSAMRELTTGEKDCFRFWHFTGGNRNEILNVSRAGVGGKEELLWSITGDDTVANEWASGSVNIPIQEKTSKPQKLQLVLRGQTTGALTSVVAVDDLLLSGWSCPRPGSCSFEDDMCNWRNVGGPQNLTWERWSGPTPSRLGPQVDNTLGTRSGNFLFLDSAAASDERVGVLESELLHYSPRSCLQFYFYVKKGGTEARIAIDYVAHGKVLTRFWALGMTRANKWVRFIQPVVNLPTAYNIRIVGYPGRRTTVDVAIDDIEVFDRGCPRAGAWVEPQQVEERNATVWDCDFDVDFCSWSQPSTPAWLIRSGKTAILKGDGPFSDSRLRSPEGKYAYFSPRSDAKSSVLASPALTPSDDEYCVQFWYFLFGIAPVELKLGLGDNKTGIATVGWHTSRGSNRLWQRGSLTVKTNPGSAQSVVVQASREGPTLGDVALDQMRIAPTGTCVHPSGSVCDFEGDGLCGFGVDTSEGGKWERVTGSTAATSKHSSDHTFGFQDEGHFMLLLLNHTSGKAPGEKQRSSIIIPEQSRTAARCLGAWFFFEGDGHANILVSARAPGTSGKGKVLGMLAGVPSYGWAFMRVHVSFPSTHEILLTGAVETEGIVAVGLDDLVLSEGRCPDIGSCDFETDLCGWENRGGSQVQRSWVRNRGTTPSAGTGLLADHTLGTVDGTYLYLDGRDPSGKGGMVGILESQPWPADLTHCLSFWVHMSGTDVGSLRVTTSRWENDDERRVAVLNLKGNQGESWQYKRVTLMPTPYFKGDFRILFVGTTGTAQGGDIALDDIQVVIGACDKHAVEGRYDCKDGKTTVNASKVCDFRKDCPGHGDDEQHCGQCEFEGDMCGWFTPNNTLFWNLTKARDAPKNSLLPPEDHSKGDKMGGYAFYVGPQESGYSQSASLSSPNGVHQLKRSGKDCSLAFWYFMPSAQSIIFRVRMSVMGRHAVIWSIKKDGGKNWHKGDVAIGRSKSEFGLTFEVIQMSQEPSAVSIDSIDFDDCALPEPSTVPCNKSHQFECSASRACILKDRLCDHVDDCGDGSDELPSVCANYSGCTFELGRPACDWAAVTPGNNRKLVAWHATIATYSRTAINSGPRVDHTVGASGHGWILLLSARRQGDLNSTAEYKSPNFVADQEDGCSLRFFYYLNGEDIGALSLYAQYEKDTTRDVWEKLWEVKGERGQIWVRASVHQHNKRPFRFVLAGTLGEDYASDMAIDDISLSPGCIAYNESLPVPPPPEMPKCKLTQFACTNSTRCIPKEQVCDFQKDCADGSDETGCGPCDFETGSCGWTDVGNGPMTWQRQQAKDMQEPNKDHTMGSASGHFMIVSNFGGVQRNKSSLLSPMLPASSSRCKMNVWYFYTAVNSSSLLRLSHITSDNEPTLLAKIASAGYVWQLQTVDIPQYDTNDAQIEISFQTTSESNRSVVAVDDISFSDCRPSSVVAACSFDDPKFNGGFCYWKANATSDNGWKIRQAAAKDGVKGPTADHTSNGGSYAFFRQGNSSQGDSAVLYSPQMPPTPSNGSCFGVWYYKNNNYLLSMVVEANSVTGNMTRFASTRPERNSWMHEELLIPFKDPFVISISARLLGNNTPNVFLAIDDIELHPGPCRQAGICDFESGYCAWQPSAEGLTKGWRRVRGDSYKGESPNVDHTLRSEYGYYLMVTPKRQGDKAILTSPLFASADERCLQFWYNMAGEKAGEFSIYQVVNGSSRRENVEPVWRRTGDKLGIWRKGHAVLPKLDNYRIVLQVLTLVSVEEGTGGYVALDDVQLSVDACGSTVSCNFEHGKCGWVSYDEGSDFSWVDVAASRGEKFGGPSLDVTSATVDGGYLYAPLAGATAQGKAILVSDDVDNVYHRFYCFRAWHYFSDAPEAELRIEQLANGNNETRKTILTVGSVHKRWTKVFSNVYTDREDSSISFLLVARANTNYSSNSKSGIAVDELEFTAGRCSGAPTTDAPTPSYPPHPLDCDFERDDCLWKNVTNLPNAFWSPAKGSQYLNHANNRPKTDHTTSSVYGTYVRLSAGTGGPPPTSRDGAAVIMESMYPLKVTKKKACIKFWFYMQGSLVQPFEFLVKDATTQAKRVLWTNTESRGPQWNYVQVPLRQEEVIYLQFSGIRNPAGETALDDISVNVGPCPPPVYCDFEVCGCGWQPGVDATLVMWNRTTATASVGNRDHTLGTNDGHVFAVNTLSDDAKKGVMTTAFSRTYSGKDAMCIRFWYQLTGGHGLEVGIRYRDAQWKQASIRSSQILTKAGWHAAQANLHFTPEDPFEYYLRASLSSRGDVIAVDDIQVRSMCPALGSCDFEEDFCLWENERVVSESPLWTRATGRSHTVGPDMDHTLGEVFGKYAVMGLTSYMTHPPSLLLSPLLTECNKRCFSFWVFHHGTVPHMLELFLRTPSGDETLEYATVADTDSRWVKAQLNLSSGADQCRIGFKPSFPPLQAAFVAVDDFIISEDSCQPLEDANHPTYSCDNGTIHLTRDRLCDFVVDCIDRQDEANCGTHCDFETGDACFWDVTGRGSTWVVENGTSKRMKDHTTLTSDGHYLTLKRQSGFSRYGKSRIVSPKLRDTSHLCMLIFWYYSAIIDERSSVKVTFSSGYIESQETTALAMRGYNGTNRREEWRRAIARIGRVRERFSTMFLGELRPGDNTYAVDDLKFAACAAHRVKKAAVYCPAGSYRCSNGKCVSWSKLCDFNDDCGDMSDEIPSPKLNCSSYVGRCDFEDGTCDWKLEGSSWRLRHIKGMPSLHQYVDDRDHTTNTIYGNFLKFSFKLRKLGGVGVLASPLVFASEGKKCYLRFYYSYQTRFTHLDYEFYNSKAGSLSVYVRSDILGSMQLLWRTSRVFGQHYERKMIALGFVTGTFQIVIQAKAGEDPYGAWAVDDVSFTNGCAYSKDDSLPALVPKRTPSPKTPCLPTEFACLGGAQCISSTRVCDFVKDCADGSDEAACANCAFENKTCGWQDVSSGKYSWLLIPQGRNGTVPATDISGKEYLMSVEEGDGSESEVAVLKSVGHGQSAASCHLEMHYFSSNIPSKKDYLKLHLFSGNETEKITLASFSRSTYGKWERKLISIGRRDRAGWFLELTATPRSPDGRIAVDDISMINCSEAGQTSVTCETVGKHSCLSSPHECFDESQHCDWSKDCSDGTDETNCEAFPGRCNFENGTCEWATYTVVGKSSWKIASGSSVSEDLGPDADHTFGNESGHYLFLRKVDDENSHASVRSTLFQKTTTQRCRLRFWYQFSFGARLDVLVRPNIPSAELVPLAVVEGNNSIVGWEKQSIALSSRSEFEVVLQGRPMGHLAIDDISFTPDCKVSASSSVPTVQPPSICDHQTQFMCRDNSCISKDMVCDFKSDCPDGFDESTCPKSCSFGDDDDCNWQSPTLPPGVTWHAAYTKEAVGHSPSAPRTDASTNSSTGYYLFFYIARTAEVSTDPVRKFSPVFQQATPDCKISFYHWTYLPMFKARLLVTSNTSKDIRLWERESGRNRKMWTQVTVGIGRRKEPFRLAFEVTPLSSWGGVNFALDEIKFLNCSYPKKLNPEAKCGEDMFYCKTRRVCIDKNRMCDLYDDCGDGSDEAKCGNVRITFDDGKTGQLRIDRPKSERTEGVLQLVQGISPMRKDDDTGPLFDHTTFNATGSYLEYGGDYDEFNKIATLSTPVILPGSCSVTFHTYMFGKQVHLLSVHKRFYKNDEAGKEVWLQEGQLGDYWVRERIDVSDTAACQVVFVVRGGNGPKDVVALDDISFSDSCRFSDQDLPEGPPGSSTATSVTPAAHKCREDQFACISDGTCLPLDQVCDLNEDCADGSDEEHCVRSRCSFEKGGLCGWSVARNRSLMAKWNQARFTTYILTNDFSWRAVQANDDSIRDNKDLRPKQDHSLNSEDGWYMEANSAFGAQDDASLLYTESRLSRTSGQCSLVAWYYCSFHCRLQLLMYDYDTNGTAPSTERTLWVSLPIRSASWRPIKTHVGVRENVRFAFRVQRVSTGKAVTALDDVALSSCNPPTTRASNGTGCTSDQFKCDGNNWCIPRGQLCDQERDCIDGSDESKTACQTLRSKCTFEEPHCEDWSNDVGNAELVWRRVRSLQYGVRMPYDDHTLRARAGSYLALYRRWQKETKETAFLASYVIQAHPSLSCKVRFWYNIATEGVTLNVYRRTSYDEGGMSHLRNLPSSNIDFWERAELDLGSSDKDFEVVIEAEFESFVNHSGIGLDDITMTDGCRKSKKNLPGKETAEGTVSPDVCGSEKLPCRDGSCYLSSQRCNFIVDCPDGTDENDCGGTCDFEDGLCGWYSSLSAESLWYREDGSPGDHTFNNVSGHFLQAGEGGSRHSYGSRAQLHSNFYAESGTECHFSLWVFGTQRRMESFNVHVKQSSGGKAKVVTVYNKTRDFDYGWSKVSIPLGRRTQFGLIVEAVWGIDEKGTLLLDDFSFQKCSPAHHVTKCTSNDWMCKDLNKCIALYEHCDGKHDCLDGSDEVDCVQSYGDCNFDHEDWTTACNWTVESIGGRPSWTRAKESPTADTGPPSSHRGRPNTFFLVAKSSLLPDGAVAITRTPEFPASHDKCHLRFWYYMNGSPSMNFLRVQTEGAGSAFPVWQEVGSLGPQWLYGHSIVGHSKPFKVVFEAMRGGDANTDIAIDEVSFTSECVEGGDAVRPTGHPPLCMENEFKCAYGSVCVPRDFVCDCEADCPDSSDETDCGNKCVSTVTPDTSKPTGRTVSTHSPPSPAPICPKGMMSCHSGGRCIPLLLLCDGIDDCPDGEDESCGVQPCPVGYYYCKDPSLNPCLHRSKLCDGRNDCSDGSDESLCGECPSEFCLHGGNCSLISRSRGPECICTTSFYGNRCNRALFVEPLTGEANVAGWSYAAPVIVLLIIAFLVGVVLFLRRRREFRDDTEFSVTNPTFNMQLNDISVTSAYAEDNEDMTVGFVNRGFDLSHSEC